MGNPPQIRTTPEAGTLSADGSRRWDGSFWVPVRPEDRVDVSFPTGAPRPRGEFFLEQRGFGLAGVIAATVIGILLTHLHLNLPAIVPLQTAVVQILLSNFLWLLFSYGTIVAILSLGRHGVDVMVLRGMAVAFWLGVALFALPPLDAFQAGWSGVLVMLVSGLVWAALAGPIFGVYASLANVIWYRGAHQLRPQILTV